MNKIKVLSAILIVALNAIEDVCGREAKPVVTFTSECSCSDDHGESRWKAKTDSENPPTTPSQITNIKPSEICSWTGPSVPITRKQDRIPAEKRWYSLTGRLVEIKAEEDGDLHIVLADVSGTQPEKVVVEIPLEEKWCAMRTKVFSWTDTTFPFETRRGGTLNIVRPQIVTVVGKAFYDVDHSGKDTRNNRRNYDQNLAVWEIHPVVKIDAVASTGASTISQPMQSSSPSGSEPGAPAQAVPARTLQPEYLIITQPVTISIPYGRTTLPAGMKLPIVSRSGETVIVRYLNGTYSLPISSTNLMPSLPR